MANPSAATQREKDYCENEVDTTCTSVDCIHGGERTVAKYYPERQEIVNKISEKEDSVRNYSPSTSVQGIGWRIEEVDENGWVPNYQTLHNAEMKYDGGTSDTTCEECHQQITWTTKNMIDTGGYSGTGDYKDAWIATNPGQSSEKVSSSSFEGGFAGKCSSKESWQQTDVEGWTCSGAADSWTQIVMVPEIEIEGTGSEVPVQAGIVIMPYIFETTTDGGFASGMEGIQSDVGGNEIDLTKAETYKTAKARAQGLSSVSDAPGLEEVIVECYNTRKGSSVDEVGSDYGFEKSRALSSVDTSKPVNITGSILMKGGDEYQCSWHYTNGNGNKVENVGTVFDISEDYGNEGNPDLADKASQARDFFNGKYGDINKSYKVNADGGSVSTDNFETAIAAWN